MQSCVQSSLMIFVILFTYNHLCFNAVSKNHLIIYVNVAVRMKQKSSFRGDCLLHFWSLQSFASGVQFPIFGTSNNYDLKFAANFGFVIVLLFCPLFLVFEPKFLAALWIFCEKSLPAKIQFCVQNKWELIKTFGMWFKVLFSIVKNSLVCALLMDHITIISL